jgi:hypothetical protein
MRTSGPGFAFSSIGLGLIFGAAACSGGATAAREPTTPAASPFAASTTPDPAPVTSTPRSAAARETEPKESVTLGDVVVSPASSVESKFAALRVPLRRCYQSALVDDPSLSVTVRLGITHVNGIITKVDTECPDVPPKLAACFRGTLVGQALGAGDGRIVVGHECMGVPTTVTPATK